MTRLVHCPHCGSLNEVDNIHGGIVSIIERSTVLHNNVECIDCEEEFSIKSDSELSSNNPLFAINAEFWIYQRPVTIPLEHEREIEFEYDLIVRKGNEIEILFMTQSEFIELQKGRRFRVFEQHCKQNIIETKGSGILPAGNNVMVMRTEDNSDNSATVECAMTTFSA